MKAIQKYNKYIIAFLLPIFILGCVQPKPGENETVIRVEQFLKGSTIVYDEAMTWYKDNHTKLSPETKDVFKFVHKNFPDTYRATDSALQLYKANQANDLQTQFSELQKLIISLTTVIKVNGGPDLVVKYEKEKGK